MSNFADIEVYTAIDSSLKTYTTVDSDILRNMAQFTFDPQLIDTSHTGQVVLSAPDLHLLYT
jgi:hypothetical protein